MYCQAENHLLESNFTQNIIAETYSAIYSFFKLLITSPLEFANELWIKTLGRPYAYDKNVLQKIFVKGLPQSIRRRIWTYLSTNKTATVLKLAYYITSLTQLQEAAHPGQQPALKMTNQNKSNNRQSNLRRESTKNVGLSSITSPDDHRAEMKLRLLV